MMKMAQTLYLLFISGFSSFALGSSEFHLIKLLKTYEEAKRYCREMYTDLATAQDSTDMNMINLVSSGTARAWIGLEIGDVWRWHWSQPGQKLDFLNWKAGEPQNQNQDVCAAMDQHGNWFESNCATKRSFVCQGLSDTSGPIFVAETKSWRNAQIHCRGLSSDLVSIHAVNENEAVRNVFGSQNVWIGLFKDPWQWSDGSNSSFRHWKPNQPNYVVDQNCVVAIFIDRGKWNDFKCNARRNFVCQGARKPIPTATNQSGTQVNPPTEPQPTNLPTPANTSPLSNVTNVPTNKATTASELTTNTPGPVSSTSSTEPNNATTKMSTVTAAQLTPTTTTTTTGGVSTLTTPAGTSAQSTTWPLTLKPTENSSPPGNVILIQENMTWTEAMGYCREHHIDLVHITSRDIQEKVAEKAKNATSPHVWLGLRYTCNFNFWFWTSSTAGCYLNWAPGEGSEGTYDCGVTGAIQATGGQQWVGLPETEKLNFLCYACAG